MMIAVQGMMKEIKLYVTVTILGHQRGGCGRGILPPMDKNFSEIWVLKLRVYYALKIEVHTQKSKILLKLLPEFQT